MIITIHLITNQSSFLPLLWVEADAVEQRGTTLGCKTDESCTLRPVEGRIETVARHSSTAANSLTAAAVEAHCFGSSVEGEPAFALVMEVTEHSCNPGFAGSAVAEAILAHRCHDNTQQRNL